MSTDSFFRSNADLGGFFVETQAYSRNRSRRRNYYSYSGCVCFFFFNLFWIVIIDNIENEITGQFKVHDIITFIIRNVITLFSRNSKWIRWETRLCKRWRTVLMEAYENMNEVHNRTDDSKCSAKKGQRIRSLFYLENHKIFFVKVNHVQFYAVYAAFN